MQHINICLGVHYISLYPDYCRQILLVVNHHQPTAEKQSWTLWRLASAPSASPTSKRTMFCARRLSGVDGRYRDFPYIKWLRRDTMGTIEDMIDGMIDDGPWWLVNQDNMQQKENYLRFSLCRGPNICLYLRCWRCLAKQCLFTFVPCTVCRFISSLVILPLVFTSSASLVASGFISNVGGTVGTVQAVPIFRIWGPSISSSGWESTIGYCAVLEVEVAAIRLTLKGDGSDLASEIPRGSGCWDFRWLRISSDVPGWSVGL